jgi:hypothetical protein
MDDGKALGARGLELVRQVWACGDASALDQAIDLLTRSLAVLSGGNPNRARYLVGLGAAFGARFDRHGDVADLDRAIDAGEETAAALPGDSPVRAAYLDSLGSTLRKRFERLGSVADLAHAISIGDETLAALHGADPGGVGYVSNVAVALGSASSARGAWPTSIARLFSGGGRGARLPRQPLPRWVHVQPRRGAAGAVQVGRERRRPGSGHRCLRRGGCDRASRLWLSTGSLVQPGRSPAAPVRAARELGRSGPGNRRRRGGGRVANAVLADRKPSRPGARAQHRRGGGGGDSERACESRGVSGHARNRVDGTVRAGGTIATSSVRSASAKRRWPRHRPASPRVHGTSRTSPTASISGSGGLATRWT